MLGIRMQFFKLTQVMNTILKIIEAQLLLGKSVLLVVIRMGMLAAQNLIILQV
jgi:inner membrane protein involved in colicin E2 resistance